MHKLNLITLYLLSLIIGLPLSIASFSNAAEISSIQLYFTSLQILMLIPLTLFIYKEFQSNNDNKLDIDLLIPAILFFIVFIFQFNLIHTNSIWLDEYTHMTRSHEATFANIVDYAFRETQPAICYVFTHISTKIFGTSELAARIPSVIFSSLGILLFYVLCRRLKVSRYLALSVSISLIVLPYFLQYSIEGRPYPIAFAYMILSIYFLVNYLEKQSLENLIILIIAQTNFIYSIGLQPPIILLCLAIAYFPQLLTKANIKKISYYFISIISPILLFLPFSIKMNQKMLTRESDRYKGFSIDNINDALNKINYDELIKFFDSLTNFSFLYITTILIIISLLLFKFFTQKNYVKSQQAIHIKAFSLISLIYPFIFLFVFFSLINWPVENRYRHLYYPIVFLSFGLNASYLASFFKNHRKLLFALAISLILIDSGNFINFKKSVYKPHANTWREFYKYLETVKNPTRAYIINLQKQQRWFPQYFISRTVYHSPEKTNVSLFPHYKHGYGEKFGPWNYLLHEIKTNTEVSNIFFVQQSNWIDGFIFEKSQFANNDKYEIIEVGTMKIISIKNIQNLVDDLIDFFLFVNDFEIESESRHRILETLLMLNYISNNKEMVNKYKNDLAALPNQEFIQSRLKVLFEKLSSYDV